MDEIFHLGLVKKKTSLDVSEPMKINFSTKFFQLTLYEGVENLTYISVDTPDRCVCFLFVYAHKLRMLRKVHRTLQPCQH